MAPTLPKISALREAFATGAVHLVDEHAQPLAFEEALDQRCWAHLRDADNGHVHVQELKSSRELLRPQLLAMLVPDSQ
jgi:hypothetical protein